jgi:radical SAM-linked protein
MRLRITFRKTDAMRFTGHLDLHRTWERTFRRAGLPLAYSHGFHPQPRINLACALPLGFTSQSEVADVWIENNLPLADIKAALDRAAPPGIEILEIEELDPPNILANSVAAAGCQATLLDRPPGWTTSSAALWQPAREQREKLRLRLIEERPPATTNEVRPPVDAPGRCAGATVPRKKL